MPCAIWAYVAVSETDDSVRIRMRPVRRLAGRPSARCSTGCTTAPIDRVRHLVPGERVVARGARRRATTPCAGCCSASRSTQQRSRRRFPRRHRVRCTCCRDRARCGRCSASGPTAAASTTASVCIRCWRRRSTAASCWSEAKEGRSGSSSRISAAGCASSRSTGCRASIGLRVEDQPDYAYGKWVAESYRDVLRKREPDLERRRRGHHLAAGGARRASATAGCCCRSTATGRPTIVLMHVADRPRHQPASSNRGQEVAQGRQAARWRPSTRGSSAGRLRGARWCAAASPPSRPWYSRSARACRRDDGLLDHDAGVIVDASSACRRRRARCAGGSCDSWRLRKSGRYQAPPANTTRPVITPRRGRRDLDGSRCGRLSAAGSS